VGGVATLGSFAHAAPAAPPLRKTIPSSGESIPAIGMGSWRTFDVDPSLQASRTAVLGAFFDDGGSVIDSSPMYGRSQAVIGRALGDLGRAATVFAADKVWMEGRDAGRRQIALASERWGVERFSLLQVHNLVDWRVHLETLFEMKARGRLAYVGVTTYAGLRHDEVGQIMLSQPIDFVQLTYNLADREAETRLLPLAAEKGIAVIANRPFREGDLIRSFAGKPLPAVAAEIGAANWAQYLLKFIVSHPAIACAVPATRRTDHMRENMGAVAGPVPDQAMRGEMLRAAIEA